jgi:hypothetical protein
MPRRNEDMNEKDDEAPFPREPWQRLLKDASGGPAETTDARIRAAARRDLAPRGHRWWLPASLAASFVLAVVLVRSELGSGGRIHVVPSADTGDAAMQGRIVDRREGEQAREPGRSPAAPAARQDKPREEAESDVYGSADSEIGQDEAGIGPRVGGPERELRSASETPEEHMPLESSSVHSELSNRAEPVPPAAAPVAAQKAAPSLARDATPEAWYAAIEKLRAEGRVQEADRELEALKKAYPGWLERHLREQKNP